MAKTPKHRGTRTTSAVDRDLLAHYLKHVRRPPLHEKVSRISVLADEYALLRGAGDLKHALGAGLRTVDLGLDVATTPAPTEWDRQRKVVFFDVHFPPLVNSFDHGHVATIARAVVSAEPEVAETPASLRAGRRRRSARAERVRVGDVTPALTEASMRAHAEAAEAFFGLPRLVVAMERLRADREVLLREGKIDAASGADHLLADSRRRLCATAAWSEESASVKVQILSWAQDDVLAADKAFGRDGRSSFLMFGLLEATIVMETARWLIPPMRH